MHERKACVDNKLTTDNHNATAVCISPPYSLVTKTDREQVCRRKARQGHADTVFYLHKPNENLNS